MSTRAASRVQETGSCGGSGARFSSALRGMSRLVCSLAWLLGGGLPALAQGTGPGIGVTLALTPTTLLEGAPTPLQATLTVSNTSGGDVLTRLGFSGEPWEVTLEFRNLTTAEVVVSRQDLQPPVQDEQPPQVVRVLGNDGIVRKVFVTGVEVLAATFSRTVTLADARTLYPLPAGVYEVKVVLPFQRFGAVFGIEGGVPVVQVDQASFEGVVLSNTVSLRVLADADGDTYLAPEADSTMPPGHSVADCDDNQAAVNPGATEIVGNGQDDDCNPGTPDVSPVAPATVTVQAEGFTLGGGTTPGVAKAPLADLPVQLFDRTSGCVGMFGTSHEHWASLWLSGCPAPANGVTDGGGTVVLTVPPGEYLALGAWTPSGQSEVVYVGKMVGEVAAGEAVTVTLRAMVRSDGSVVPGKTSKHTGSVLEIIEPEYVEWDSVEELYPFVFASEGAWGVTTTVTPPPGFVADHESLSAEVQSTLAAVQFTVTDVGSDWVDTEVTYDLTHTDTKGKVKKQKVKSKVGVKLSKALAASLGLTKWGKPKGKKP